MFLISRMHYVLLQALLYMLFILHDCSCIAVHVCSVTCAFMMYHISFSHFSMQKLKLKLKYQWCELPHLFELS